MANSRLEYEDLIGKLAEIVRARGFEGTSMSGLALAVGLEKASLYHYFPGGKDEIVQAVIQHIRAWLQEHVLLPLESPGAPARRVRAAANRLREYYGDGKKMCALDTLSLPAGSDALREALKLSAEALLLGFANVAKDSGIRGPQAQRRAEQALIDIEGSLVLARVLGDQRIFLRVIERLPAQLTEP